MKKIVLSVFALCCAGLWNFITAQEQYDMVIGIEQMFELADRNSSRIKTFEIAEREAQQAVSVAKNALLPNIGVSLSFSYIGNGWMSDRDFSNSMNAPMPHFGNNLAIEASQVVYAGGAISNSINVAKLQYQLAVLEKENNRRDVRFLLVANYLELYKLDNQLKVYEKNIRQTEMLLDEIRIRQKEGVALKNDITRYELQLKSLELALTQVKNSRIIMNDQLTTVLGLSKETVVRVDTASVREIPALDSEDAWMVEGAMASPVLRQAKINIAISRHNEKIINAESLPQVSLFAADSFDGPILIEVPPINKNFNYWCFGIGIKYNISSLYKTGKKRKLTELSTLKAVENEELARKCLNTNIRECYIRFSEAFTVYDTQVKSLELAQQNYKVVNHRYLNDLALITDMLDASNSKLSAELLLSNARINILFNYYKLRRACGTI